MTLENRSPVNDNSGSQRENCAAISSSKVLASEYDELGRGWYSSSTGRYGGGESGPNGSPSTVSLDAQTTVLIFAALAAANTWYVLVMLLSNVAALVVRPGAGIAARCTTASIRSYLSSTPSKAARVCP